MRFLVDECAGPILARWLADKGHEVYSVFDLSRGITDVDIIEKAVREGWIIVTADKDFGDLVYRDGRSHKGVVLLRLEDERAISKIAVMEQVLLAYSDRIPGAFVVATERRVRFSGIKAE